MTHVQGLYIILYKLIIYTDVYNIYKRIMYQLHYIKYISMLLVINDETSTIPPPSISPLPGVGQGGRYIQLDNKKV